MAVNVCRNQEGIVLVTTVLILSLLLGAATGVILSTRTDLRTSANLKRRSKSFYIAQAGLDHGWQELMDGDGVNDFNAVFAQGRATVLFRKRVFSAGSYSVTATPLATTTPHRIRVVSSGCLPAADPCPAGHSLAAIEGQFIAVPLFSHALLAKERLSIAQGALIDSFDSRTGPYNFSEGGTAGHVSSNGDLLLRGARTLIRGDASAAGRVVLKGSRVEGTVVNGAKPVKIPSLYSPCGSSFSDGAGITGGQYDPRSGELKAIGTAPVTFSEGRYCLKEIDLPKGRRLVVTGRVSLYVSGRIRLRGAVMNQTQMPGNLMIVSAFSSRDHGVVASGGTGAAMVIYAPHTGVKFQGHGDYYGSVVAARIDNDEGTRIHFDRALEGGENIFVKRLTWRELY